MHHKPLLTCTYATHRALTLRMGGSDILFTLTSCIAIMALVAWVSWYKTRGTTETREGYFLAGRGLGATFIAGSLLLTNLSAEQLIGLNGSAYG